jgi:hypothetical protein
MVLIQLPWLVGLLMMLAAVRPAWPTEASDCHAAAMSFDRNTSVAHVVDYDIRLDGPDAPAAPLLWEGPVVVTDRHNHQVCSWQPVGLISRPLLALNNGTLFLVTTSGSNFMIESVLLETCRAGYKSGKLSGPIEMVGEWIVAGGHALAGFPCERIISGN